MKNIAYVTTSFAKVSHTFIRREVLALRHQNVTVVLFGIRPVRELVNASDEALILDQETTYLYPLKWLEIIYAIVWLLMRNPYSYLKAFIEALFNEEIDWRKHFKLFYHFLCSAYVARKMFDNEIGHVHAHFMNVPATIAMYSAQLLGVPFSITQHSGGIAGLAEFDGVKRKYFSAKFLCPISEYTKNYYFKNFGSREGVFMIHCGLDISKYRYDPLDNFPKNKRLRLIAVGRLEEKKGFFYLIEALKILSLENFDFELVLIGEGALYHQIRERVKGYSLTDKVRILGACSEYEVQYQVALSDICIVPSVVSSTGETEGLPVVIMEAMALGVLVVASRHAGIPELVLDKQTGLLVTERNPVEIAEAIKAFIQNPLLRHNCRIHARELIIKDYDINKVAVLKKDVFKLNI